MTQASRKVWFSRILELIIVGVVIYVFSYYFHNPFCGFIFRCGCTFGKTQHDGWKPCNIHNVSGPHCPFCAAKKSVVWLIDTRSVDVLMFVSYVIVAMHHWKDQDKQRKRILLLNGERTDDVDATVITIRGKCFYVNDVLKRLWIPFAVFTIYDAIVGFIFYLATDYPYFMFWK